MEALVRGGASASGRANVGASRRATERHWSRRPRRPWRPCRSRCRSRRSRRSRWPWCGGACYATGRNLRQGDARCHHRQAGCRHQDRPHPRQHPVLTASRASLASCHLRAPQPAVAGTPASVGRTCRVCGTTGGAKGLPSVVLGVRPGGAAAECVAVGERLLAINGEPVIDHEAASQLLREATGEVVPPHGHSTLAARPQLPSSPCDLSSAPAPPRGAPGGSGRPKALRRPQARAEAWAPGPRAPGQGSRPQGESRGQCSRPQGERRLAAGRRYCLGCSSLPTRRSPPGTAHRTRRCREQAHRRGEHARRPRAAGGATFAADVWHCSS